jgi:type IV pilus assembly protein PilQ
MRPLLLLAVVFSLTAAAKPPPLKISLEVQRADLHGLLRVLGEAGRLNFVVGDEVTGTVTLRLRNVTLAEAIDAVLASRGLGTERLGSIVRVAPLAQLAAEAKARADLVTAREAGGPLVTSLIRVNYASADAIAPLVKAQLSPRGTVAVDARTNTLIVRDVER